MTAIAGETEQFESYVDVGVCSLCGKTVPRRPGLDNYLRCGPCHQKTYGAEE